MDTEQANSRLQELEFLVSIMSDLAHTYKGHNVRLLEELISNLNHRIDSEETTAEAKFKSEQYIENKMNGILSKNYHHIT